MNDLEQAVVDAKRKFFATPTRNWVSAYTNYRKAKKALEDSKA